jgi:Tfp pilus assembly protein PilZ
VRPSILIVADKPDTFLSLSQVLLKFSCQVLTAYPEPDAMKAAREEKPWMVILRPPRPTEERDRCFAMVRDLFHAAEIPVLALIDAAADADVVRAYLGEAPALLANPLPFTRLYDWIQESLRAVKRYGVRVQTDLVVAHREPGMYREDFYFYDRMRSLSSGGCFVETRKPYPVGEQIEMIFCVGGNTGSLRVSARVCRHGTDDDGHAGMGLAFTDLQPAVLASIEAFLNAQLGTPALAQAVQRLA